MVKKFVALSAMFVSIVLSAQVPETLQDKVAALVSDQALENALVGVCVKTADGKTLVDINSEKMMLPASNMKLISTGAALHALGGDWQYETSLGYDGTIEDGVLKGDLYIIGGGDPTVGSKDSIAVSLDKTFAQWTAILRSSGISSIEGRIVGDGRSFEGMPEEPTWLWNDIGTYYGAGSTGLMFYENMQSFSVSAGTAVGAPVNISPYYPEAPWMEFRYNCTTGKKGTGDQLYMYTSDLAPVAEIRGTFGLDKPAKRVDCANKFPEYTCAWYFYNYLKKNGIECLSGPADLKLTSSQSSGTVSQSLSDSEGKLTILGSTFSPTMERIAFETNHASNNLFAETLFRTLGKELRQSACYDSSYVALNDVLKTLSVSTKGLKVQDGSGLSRQNYVSADFFCRFLDAMMDSDSFGIYLSSLPVPGGNGTLQYNMKGQSLSLRQRIKVKSGSMNGVRCYSGYILPKGFISESGVPVADYDNLPEDIKSKTLVFSIMTNNCTSPSWKVRPLLDKIMVCIASHEDLYE